MRGASTAGHRSARGGEEHRGARLARGGPHAALVDVNDVRHLVVGSHAAPWDGPEGVRQQRLGVRNACALVTNLTQAGFDVVVVDVLDRDTAAFYRELLPAPLVVRLRVAFAEARRRARTRPGHLSTAEFRRLHEREALFHGADVEVDTTGLSVERTARLVGRLWTGSGAWGTP